VTDWDGWAIAKEVYRDLSIPANDSPTCRISSSRRKARKKQEEKAKESGTAGAGIPLSLLRGTFIAAWRETERGREREKRERFFGKLVELNLNFFRFTSCPGHLFKVEIQAESIFSRSR
jgi:hypothetical protein